MNIPEKKMVDLLIDLKNDYNVIGVKTEFEAEGATFKEALKLKKLASASGIEYTIKIGGCEAIKDIMDAKQIGVNTIVAPMIESSYALSKFINAIESVFSDDERKTVKLMINLETITGFNNFNEIISSPYFEKLQGIVIGRADLAASMNLGKDHINSQIILKMINSIISKVSQFEMEFGIGGGISPESLPFFRKFEQNTLRFFETRKIIFDAQRALEKPCIEQGILKAIEFEIMWIEYQMNGLKDKKRLDFLKNRHKNLSEKNSIIFLNQ